eukprot:780964-Amphidinium_carterae.1
MVLRYPGWYSSAFAAFQHYPAMFDLYVSMPITGGDMRIKSKDSFNSSQCVISTQHKSLQLTVE